MAGHFRQYAEYRQLADRDITQIFPLFLKDSAIDWYETLTADMKNDLDSLLGNFKAYFGKTELDYVFADETVFTRVQRPNEKARNYISQMQKLAKRVPYLEDEILHWVSSEVYVRGSRPASSHRKITSNPLQTSSNAPRSPNRPF